MQAEFFKFLLQIRAIRVHCNAPVRNEDINNAARSDNRADMFNNRRNSAAHKGRNNNSKARALRRVGMPSDRPANHAVGTGENIHVEISVNFKRGKNNKIQLFRCRCNKMACIIRCAYLMMKMVVLQRFCRIKVKRLNIKNAIYQPFFMHCRDLPSDSAESKTAANALIQHFLADESRRCKRCTAGTHLH